MGGPVFVFIRAERAYERARGLTLHRCARLCLTAALWLLLLPLGGCGGDDRSKGRAEDKGVPHKDRARFFVGAASVSVDPEGAVYAGGNTLGPPVTRIHDPLSVRALYISNGQKAVAFAVADSQGWFASCQEGEEFGITGVRHRASAAMSGPGRPPVGPADIIVQATHSHAAPTVQGIWGPVPPEYLRLLGDRTVEALATAAQNARAAFLRWGKVEASFLNNITTAQYDSYPGWAIDGQLSVLDAVGEVDGEPVATFVSVPTHPDIVCGACLELLSADYPGVVRKALEEKLGGVVLVGPATVGRQEAPVQAQGLAAMEWLAGVIESLAFEALSEATWVTDQTVAAVESLVTTRATNTPLLLLNHAWSWPPDLKDWIAAETGKYPINRAVVAPYLDGRWGSTWVTAIRIGRLLYLSMPGEPFPEVTLPIAAAVKDADGVVSLSKAQDDLGYFYPEWVYPYTSLYPSDHGDFNVSTHIGETVIDEHIKNAASLGFETERPASTHLATDWARAFWPGLQAMASPLKGCAGDDGTLAVTLQGFYEPALFEGRDIQGMIEWNFGDGGSARTSSMERIVHPFAVGSHIVTLSAVDSAGRRAYWSIDVHVYPQVRASVIVEPIDRAEASFTARVDGGIGEILAWRWTFSDGQTAFGPTVRHRFESEARERTATVAIADASGCTASATASFAP